LTRFAFASASLLLAACGADAPGPRPPGSASPPASSQPASGHYTPRTLDTPAEIARASEWLAAHDTPDILHAKYGGATISDEARGKALVGIAEKWSALRGTPQGAAALAKHIAAQPEFEAAGVVEGMNVWARFKDGRVAIVSTLDAPALAAKRAPAAPPPPEHHATRAKEISESKSGGMTDAFGFDLTASITKWSHASGWAESRWDPTVENLKTNVKDAGLFYINTHGGMGFERPQEGKDGFFWWATEMHDRLYSYATTTPVTNRNGAILADSGSGPGYEWAIAKSDADYKDLLDSGQLVYFLANFGEARCSLATWHYAITRHFVHEHFKFAKDSFVFANVCSSITPQAADMYLELKRTAGLVLGWSGTAHARTAILAGELLMSRMLGGNDRSGDPGWSFPPDKPPGRPWSFKDAMAEITDNAIDLYNPSLDGPKPAPDKDCPPSAPSKTDYTKARFKWLPSADADVLLRPSIRNMDVDERKHELVLHGDFGEGKPEDGKVTVGAADCKVTSWKKDEVRCDLGEGFVTGQVVAAMRDRKSNPAPLTGWTVKVDDTLFFPKKMPGDFGMGWKLEVKFRGDVHASREKPHDAPVEREPFVFLAHPSSTCLPKMQGKYAAKGGSVALEDGAPVPVWRGDKRPDMNGACILFGKIEPKTKTIQLAMMAFGKSAATMQVNPSPHAIPSLGFMLLPVKGLFSGEMSLSVLLDTMTDVPPDARSHAGRGEMPLARLDLPLDATWGVQAGKKGPVDVQEIKGVTASLEWSGKTESPPDDQTPQ
jgi:hypothetical protein